MQEGIAIGGFYYATASMISEIKRILQVRNRTCGGVLDPLGCRIRATHEQIHVIVRSGPPPSRPHPH